LPPDANLVVLFRGVDDLCHGASSRVEWAVQKAVLERGDPKQGPPDFNDDKWTLPRADNEPRLGIFDVGRPRLDEACVTREYAEYYLANKVMDGFKYMVDRGVSGQQGCMKLAGQLRDHPNHNHQETTIFSETYQIWIQAFDDLLCGQSNPHDHAVSERVSKLQLHPKLKRLFENDPVWANAFSAFASTGTYDKSVKPWMEHLIENLKTVAETNNPYDLIPKDLLTTYMQEGHDFRLTAEQAGKNLEELDSNITKFMEGITEKLVAQAPPHPWNPGNCTSQKKKLDLIQEALKDVSNGMLHNEEMLLRIMDVVSRLTSYDGIITQRLAFAQKLLDVAKDIFEVEDCVDKKDFQLQSDKYSAAMKSLKQLGEYKFENGPYEVQAEGIASRIKATIDKIVAASEDTDGGMLTVVSGSKVVEFLYKMTPEKGAFTAEGRKLKDHHLACGVLGYKLELKLLTTKLQKANVDKTDPRDRTSAASKLQKKTEVDSTESGLKNLKDQCKAEIQEAEGVLKTFKGDLLKTLAKEYGMALDAWPGKKEKATWLTEEERVKKGPLMGPDELAKKAEKPLKQGYDGLRDWLTSLNEFGRKWTGMKGEWKFNHPVEKRVPDTIKKASILLTELGMLQALKDNTDSKAVSEALKKEKALMASRGVVEADINESLLGVVKPSRRTFVWDVCVGAPKLPSLRWGTWREAPP